MTTKDEALNLALEAMNLARAAHGQMLLSDPPQEAWKAWGVSAALTKAMTATSEALAEHPAQQQEPVAWRLWDKDPLGGADNRWTYFDISDFADGVDPTKHFKVEPLYTSPPYEATPLASQRSVKPWVGLTRKQVEDFADDGVFLGNIYEITASIEAKLKEKNT